MNYALYTSNKSEYVFADGVSPFASRLHPPEQELVDRYSVLARSWASSNACSSDDKTGN